MTATITTQDEALEQLSRLYEALAAMRNEIEPVNPRNLAVLAEGHLEETRQLQNELDEYAARLAGAEPLARK